GRIVDQDIEPPLPFGEAEHRPAHALAGRDILRERDRAAAAGLDLRDRLVDEFLLQIVDADDGAAGGHVQRRRPADAVPPPRDQRGLTCEFLWSLVHLPDPLLIMLPAPRPCARSRRWCAVRARP